jgi:predicted small lipoprotein YifL
MTIRYGVMLALACVLAVSACGYKGKLRTPSQAAQQEEKKARKQEKEAAKQAEEQADKAGDADKTGGQ